MNKKGMNTDMTNDRDTQTKRTYSYKYVNKWS